MPTRTAKPKVIKIKAHKVYRKRPGSSKLISASRYFADFKQRWAIHNYEIKCLIDDIGEAIASIKPYHEKLVNLIR